MKERDIQAAVFDHFRVARTPRAMLFANANARAFGQPGLSRGVFDITAISPDGTVGFLELKTAKGKLSPDQTHFANCLQAAGVRHAIAYGRDEPIAILKKWGVIT